MSFDVHLLRHVSVLDARVEKLEVAGKEIPPRQVVSTATYRRRTESGTYKCVCLLPLGRTKTVK